MLTPAAQSLRLMVLDPHAVARFGLLTKLEQEPGLIVIGSYASSRELMDGLRMQQADIVLTEFSLGQFDIDGLNLIRALKICHPMTKTLVVSAHYSAAIVSLALKAGARGYVDKSQALDHVVTAVRAVAMNRVHLLPDMAGNIAQLLGGPLPHPAEALAQHPRLSPREREVVRCCLDGLSVTEIATKRSRSSTTISTQKRAAFRKLGIRNDIELFKIRQQLDK